MTRHHLGAWMGAVVLIGLADQSFAQSLFGGSRYGYRDYTVELTLARAALMVVSTMAGYGLGWFFSPQAKELRRAVLAVAALGALAIALLNHGVLGWSTTALVSMVGFCLALGYWIGTAVKSLGEVPTTFGSARWATADDLAAYKLWGKSGIYLGEAYDGETMKTITYKGDRHMIVSGASRTHKGTSLIIPNLLSYQGSTVMIDPKGENALISAQARQEMGQQVCILDPWGIAPVEGITPVRFNPLDWLQDGDPEITENAMILADALVPVRDDKGDRFWVEEAKALIQGLLLYVATDPHEDGHRHLGRVRDLLLLDGKDLTALFERMLGSPHHVVASTGARCLQKEEKLLTNVLASAQAETHFLDSAKLRENLSVSDFRFEDLKTTPMSLYLVLPADRLHPFANWLRMLLQQALTITARNIAVQPDKPILFILDEMAALGRLSMIEQAYGLMAGFGMQLFGVVQDLSQLERIYGKSWQSFIANAGVVSYFGSTDRMLAEYFSALCGETTVWNFSSAIAKAVGTSTGKGGTSSSSSTTTTDTRAASQRKLAYPDELMRMHRDKQLLLVENMPPLLAQKRPWFANPELADKGVNLRAS
ncbi:MAG: type IV secretory system conjugative DNA transfer family protein [Rhodobacteraceae bacterium]|nr:type IV secretory system conjugative DNA transfer family protein [Paracoccaceae bacterium]